MSQAHSLSTRDLWLLALLTLTWGVNWPVMKFGILELPPMAVRAASMIGGLALIAAIARMSGVSLRVPRGEWRELVALALTNLVLWQVLAIYGLKLLPSGRAAILAYTMPLWAALIGIVLFRENPGRRLWIGVGAAGAGVLLLVGGEAGTMTGRPLGTGLMLTAAFVWGFGAHLTRRRRMTAHILAINYWSLVMGIAVCGTISLVFERAHWTRVPDALEWAAIAFNAFVVFGFAQVAWLRLATILTPVASGLSVMTIPVVGVFSGMVVLGEHPSWRDWVALVAILAAMATVVLPSRGQGAAAAERPRG